jgi:hypothetical protein
MKSRLPIVDICLYEVLIERATFDLVSSWYYLAGLERITRRATFNPGHADNVSDTALEVSAAAIPFPAEPRAAQATPTANTEKDSNQTPVTFAQYDRDEASYNA